MAETSNIRATTEDLTDLIWEKDHEGLTKFVDQIPLEDLHLAVSRIGPSHRSALLEILDPADAAGLLLQRKELSPDGLLSRATPETAANILHELPSDVRADFFAALTSEAAAPILALLPKSDVDAVHTLARYAPDVAGGVMATELLMYPETATVGHVTDDLRRNAAEYANYDIQYVYVTREDQSLAGVLRIRDLLLSDGGTVLADRMFKDPATVNHLASLKELRDTFELHRYLGLPVVDDDDRLVGVVRRAAVEEAIAQRTARQLRLVQGIIGGEEVRTMPVGLRSGRRLAWLSANIVLNVLAASVIVYFESTLARLIALAAFLPIISDMSGCSGNQAVAVSMRELSLGLVRPRETLWVWAKEVKVGLINGTALGLLLGLVAWLWRGNPVLGIIVGAALALNTVVAVSIGGTIPLVFKALGVDPALASGPILTTVTDICGFFFALGLAALALSHGYL